ncbi:MAG TPA: GPW/gp25 family protein [Opitutaceae bacterium]
MSDTIPIERLQPCLLDRLTDEEPQNPNESRLQRVVSMQRYKRGVLRDLVWLFNTSAHMTGMKALGFEIEDYPEAARSVVNFGTRQICGLTAPDMEELERQLLEAVQLFEPRILPETLSVRATMKNQLIGFEIEGDLWANPIPEKLFIKTQIDMESGQTLLGEGADG